MPIKKRRAKRKPARKSTALARRPRKTYLKTYDCRPRPVVRRMDVLPPERTIDDDIHLGDLGLVEIKLKPREELVLNQAIPVDEVMIKPTGQAYLSHPTYTRIFNQAFGRLGWNIVPAAKPVKDNRSVVVPYILYIHGRPAAFAMGEQEYFENNKEQTYGDAIESTIASALRRCAKRLGIWLELWDRAWLETFIMQHCVRVRVSVKIDGRDKTVNKWRRKRDAKFWNEVGNEPAGEHAYSGEKVTPEQVKRLWVVTARAGRTHHEVKTWLLRTYKLLSSKDIRRRDYNSICVAIEKPGVLGTEGGGLSPAEMGEG